ncbi:polycystic kidney disease and receptor for egg jelly-related protein-like [Rhagoletis pomonella]|uniref:polycystic kidney disease and receptor for egg jelly-related protein-like n=1 Tax=Rhagoletis pomonella TaxID=28610 RepID=UPI0017852ED8|nr:polycystic kidney disease and receptor for egg jelly-related protein-like [Rhagoletis pomonella]
MKYFLQIVLLTLILICQQHFTRASEKLCPIGNCNNAGPCTIEAERLQCSCLANYYSGLRCQDFINNCEPNPCRNGGSCQPALGQFFCNCVSPWGGQQCGIRGIRMFTKMHVLFNPVGIFGERHNFLLTVETLGTADFIYEAFTNNCLIDTFESYTHRESSFRYSRNLRSVARSLGLVHADRLPYNIGYYHDYYESFWEAGTLNVRVRVADMQSRELYDQFFELYIIQPAHVPCIPDIGFMHGANPQEPLIVDIARFNFFNAIIHKHCASDSRLEIEWTVHNSIGTVLLFEFGNSGKKQLKVKPYQLWFNYHGAVAQSYMIRVNVDEHQGGTVVHKKVRCYIFVMSKPVSALILGGSTREVGVRQSFFLDGSQSRDFALSPLVEQTMNFKWSCTSADDSSNSYCHEDMGTASKLNIPAGVLQLGKSYTFKFQVNSYVSTMSRDVARQIIQITNEPRHYVFIECVRNCAMAKYAAGRKIHLLVRCPTCGARPTITWTVSSGGSFPSNARRIGFMPPASGEITVEASTASDSMSGKCKITLYLNEPPNGGQCSIEPSSGVEYETEFHITCDDFEDPNTPITYQYIADTFTFDRTNERLMRTRLPLTNSLKVVICDFLYACTETQLSVSVSPMQVPLDETALRLLLSQSDSNIAKLLEDGDVERAMVLADVLTRSTLTLAMGEIIFYQLRWLKLETLLQVEQMTKVTRNLLAPLQPLDNMRVSLFTKFFRKISVGFHYAIADREYQELLHAPYEVLNNEVVDLIAEFSAKLEDMPPVVRIQPASSGSGNRLSERYAPLPDFDETVLARIENWLDVIFESFRCLHYVGISGTIMHEPTDDHYILNKPGVKVDVFSIEGTNMLKLETANRKIEIIVPSGMLAELERILKSAQLLFQVVSFERNPFWWYPDTEPINTGIVSFSVYSAADPLREDTFLENPIEFRMSLSASTPATDALNSLVEGYVKDSLDMPIYRIEMPENTAAIVKFSDPTTRLCVKLDLCTKPRSYQMRDSADFVPEKHTFHVVNDKGGNVWAYLAVMAADEISTLKTFKFEITMLKCLVWDFKPRDPEWSTTGCVPKLNLSDAENLSCSCYHLSTFAGKKHPTAAMETNTPRHVLTRLPTNGYMVVSFFFLLLLFSLLFCCAWRSLRNHKGELITLLDQEDYNKEFGVNVHISTGGHWHAATSANVILMFAVPQGTRKFIIFQNPENPHLVRNSTCTLRLPLTGDDLAQPLLLSIRRDNSGRYPSWYCRRIVIEDYANEIICSFEVEAWITTKPLVLDAANFREGSQSFKRAFRDTLESLCIQWFLFQALVGPWKYGDSTLNRFERTCIWTVKLAVTICIVACYMGPTTLKTYEEERDKYNNIAYDWVEIFFLCIFSYIICFFVEIGLKAFIYHDELERENAAEEYIKED